MMGCVREVDDYGVCIVDVLRLFLVFNLFF